MNTRRLAILLLFLIPAATHAQLDSLLNALPRLHTDTDRINTLNAISWLMKNKGDYAQAMDYAKKALALAENHAGDPSVQKGKGNALNNIGLAYYYQGNYPEALRQHLEALRIREAIHDQKGTASSYNNIGLVYWKQANYSEARKNYMICLRLRERIHDTQGVAVAYNNLAILDYENGDYPKALVNDSIALSIREKLGELKGISMSLNNLGNVESRLGHFTRAIQHYTKALQGYLSLGDKEGISFSYNNLGELKVKMGRYEEARPDLLLGLKFALATGSKDNLKASYYGLSVVDSAKGDFRQSLEDYRSFVLYRDSLLNQDNTKKIVQAQMQYEFDKKETASRAEQEKKDAVAIAESRKQKMILFSVLACLLLVVLFAVFIFRSFREKQKANIEITRQKEIIEEKQREILGSIRYARRIQRSLLPGEKYIEKILSGPFKKNL